MRALALTAELDCRDAAPQLVALVRTGTDAVARAALDALAALRAHEREEAAVAALARPALAERAIEILAADRSIAVIEPLSAYEAEARGGRDVAARMAILRIQSRLGAA